jgi:hypothetical protein
MRGVAGAPLPSSAVCAGRVQYSICIMNWIWRAFSVSTGWL